MRAAFALRIISGKIILNFGVQKRLRAFLNLIFTGGVVKENGIYSAASYGSAAPCGKPPILGTPFCNTENFPVMPKAPSLRELSP